MLVLVCGAVEEWARSTVLVRVVHLEQVYHVVCFGRVSSVFLFKTSPVRDVAVEADTVV